MGAVISKHVKMLLDHAKQFSSLNWFWMATVFGSYFWTKHLLWTIRNKEMQSRGVKVLKERNAKVTKFNTAGLDVELITSLDLAGLREELLKGTFSCSDLVNVFGERC